MIMMLVTGDDDDGGGGGSGVIRLNIRITIILSRRLLYLLNTTMHLPCSHLSKKGTRSAKICEKTELAYW